jgi:uncharacterized protein YdiU (UPF0061 family)
MKSKFAMDSQQAGWRFENSYTRLPEAFFKRTAPEAVSSPSWVIFNRPLAAEIGLDPDALKSGDGLAFFSGNAIPDGAAPVAQAYAGHQFGHFTMLGDGRAVLIGEHLGLGGARFDMALKGSGRTAYSRRGDGRAALGPMLREYLISEAMHGLGIPTTRSLAVVRTGETVFRDGALPGAVLTRIASSHIRVGTFEYAALLQDVAALRALADYTMQRHYPDFEPGDYRSFLEAAIGRQASLVAKWMLVGFIHGVMNTDNMALSGETIDYGPCAFLDAYDPSTVFSSIDRNGRYAYANQPGIAHWNLARFAEAILPLLDSDENKAVDIAKESLGIFPESFQKHWLSGMRAKLGLFDEEAGDVVLFESFLHEMQRRRSDYTLAFRSLDPRPTSDSDTGWNFEWKARLARQPQTADEAWALMRRHNPVVIPRNHKVEEALQAATTNANCAPCTDFLPRWLIPLWMGRKRMGSVIHRRTVLWATRLFAELKKLTHPRRKRAADEEIDDVAVKIGGDVLPRAREQRHEAVIQNKLPELPAARDFVHVSEDNMRCPEGIRHGCRLPG